jgi:hypothetical protein
LSSVVPLRRCCLFFFDLTFQSLALDVQSQAVIDAHVLIGDPNQRQPRDQITSPIAEQQFVSREKNEDDRDVMTEAIFARKQIKEFSCVPSAAILTAALTVFARLAKDLFVRDGPRHASDRNRQQEQLENLKPQSGHGRAESLRQDCFKGGVGGIIREL